MKRSVLITTAFVMLFAAGSLAVADTIPEEEINVFTAGQPAVAAEMNENFNNVQAAVNDNANTITAIQSDYITAVNVSGGLVGGGTSGTIAIAVGSNALTASHIGAGAVGTSEVADDSLTASDIAAGAIGSSELATSAVTSIDIAEGTITGADIANETITGANIDNGSITGSDIASSTITGANIANESITSVDIDNYSIQGYDIATSGITGTQIASSSIYDTDIADEPGIEYSPSQFGGELNTNNTVQRLSYIAISAPTSGYIHVTYTGSAYIGGDHTMAKAGIVINTSSTAPTAFDSLGFAYLGNQRLPSGGYYYQPFVAQYTYYVGSDDTYYIHALGQRMSAYDDYPVFLNYGTLTATFYPTRY